MAKSEYKFDRWNGQLINSWPSTLYRRYNEELKNIFGAHLAASKFTYKKIKLDGLKWSDKAKGVFEGELSSTKTIKEWSTAYNSFENWATLNALLALSSNFETYLAAVIRLALTSDPGVLIGMTKSVDGVLIKKLGKKENINISQVVENCTKGDWSSRLSSFESQFGSIEEFRDGHSDLEYIRRVRNEVAHAFGRDIEESRKIGQVRIIPIRKLTSKKYLSLERKLGAIVKAIDCHLMENHIGEYEVIDFYINYFEDQRDLVLGQRAVNLKKAIGKFGSHSKGKVFCKGLIQYWDAL